MQAMRGETLRPFKPKKSRKRGGRVLTNKGYVIVKAPGHPRAQRKGYVFEHILVAEAKYGIVITRDYSIHHLNGVRDDNRPQNLELRVGPHGRGASVVDALWMEPEARRRMIELVTQHQDEGTI